MSLATPIALERLRRLAHVSRAGYYRRQDAPPAVDPDLDLRDKIQRIALEFPSYGWPRITAELRRRGWKANHKRVYRIMRGDNLLCLRRRKFVVTTYSNHSRPIYPNLARGMVLTGIDQLWIADITYIRLETEFVYLAVVLDACCTPIPCRPIDWAETWMAGRPALEERRGAQAVLTIAYDLTPRTRLAARNCDIISVDPECHLGSCLLCHRIAQHGTQRAGVWNGSNIAHDRRAPDAHWRRMVLPHK
jgi:hypothetical protein